MEHKQTEATITAVDEAQGIVEAIWAVMGNIDSGNDIIHPGSFTKTFNERGHQVKLLDNHRTDSVMASLGLVKELREIRRAELPQELMERYPEATGGAWGKFQFLLDTPEGKGAFTRIQKGAIRGWSFGYDAVDKDMSTVTKDGRQIPVRNLRQIKLWEVSPVLFAMNEATTTTDAKSAPTEGKPYRAIHEGDTWNVYKLDGAGKPTGKPLGKHPSEDEADAQIAALYANEDDDKSAKAKWTAAYINNLPDSSFLHIESGGEKDEDGKTTPRSLRHLPYKDAEGNVDLPHLRNAISRLGQTDTGSTGGESWLSEDLRKRLLSRAKRLLEQNNKAINLSQQVEDVRQAFHAQYNAPNGPWRYWVNTVYDEYLIVCYEGETGSEYYQIAYSQDGERYAFAPMSEWIEGVYEFTSNNEKSFKAGRVLSARNAKRIKAAMDELHTCLMEAGLMEMPDDEEANTGPQKSDTDTPTPKAQGAGPNEDDSTRLLKLIELELEETEA